MTTAPHDDHQKLRARPLQLVETSNGVILKRGRTEFRISGEGAKSAITTLLSAFADAACVDEVVSSVPEAHQPAVETLINQLVARRLLMPLSPSEPEQREPEGPLDIFYWHFDTTAAEVERQLGSRRIQVIGVNNISLRLASSLPAAYFSKVEVIDDPLLRNLSFFDESSGALSAGWSGPLDPMPDLTPERLDAQPPDCLVATSDFGGQHILRGWNRICVERNLVFLPIILQDLIGYVGPVVVPGETACYECVWLRQNSHMRDPAVQRAADLEALDGQGVVGAHPSMAAVLADIATMELTKYFSGVIPGRRAGAIVEVNLLRPLVEAHKVLKVPRCPVCGPLNHTSPLTTQREARLPFD
jgi:bacteriocin biosynthesis cyclodehydratase domain-containing protein